MSDEPRRLSDIDLAVDGFTADDVVRQRLARDTELKKAAARGNWFASEAMRLAAEARQIGCYGGSPWDEEISDEDMGGMW